MLRYLPGILLLLWIVGCSSSDERTSYEKYSVGFSNIEWKKISNDNADISLEHEKSGLIFYATSFCNDDKDEQLAESAERLYSGLRDLKYLEEKEITFLDKEAYSIEAQGKLEGSQVYMKSLGQKRNGCYFDFVLISTKALTEKERSWWSQITETVRFN